LQAEVGRAPDRSARGFGGEALHGFDVAAEVAHDIDGVRMQRLDLKIRRALGRILDPHAHVAEEQVAELSVVDPLFRQLRGSREAAASARSLMMSQTPTSSASGSSR